MADIFLYPGAASPTDITLSDPTTTRAVAITGTGDCTAPAGAISATLLETFLVGGDVTAPAGTIASTLLETFAGSGAIAALPGAISANGLETFAAAADVTAPVGAIAATDLEQFTGTADVTAPPGAVAAAGQVSQSSAITGTADMTAPVGAIDAQGQQAKIFGRPWVQAAAQTKARRAVMAQVQITGTVDVTAAPGTISGSSHLTHVLQGGMAAPAGAVSATGRMSDDAIALWLLGWDEAA